MYSKKSIYRSSPAKTALLAALSLRRKLGIELHSPVCPYDLAESLGVEVRFLNTPSMEGLYVKEFPAILLSSERPPGRMSFTCAHELGHHIFGHGNRIDELQKAVNKNPYQQFGRSPEEYLADLFAGFLLMPKVAVEYAISNRGYHMASLTPEQIYFVAANLGVGYSSLIYHASSVLNLITPSQKDELKKTKPKQIRSNFLGHTISQDVWNIDSYWCGKPVDTQVGDIILVSNDFSVFETHLTKCGDRGKDIMYRASSPGTTLIRRGDLAPVTVRVSKRNYSGRARYRYLDVEDYKDSVE